MAVQAGPAKVTDTNIKDVVFLLKNSTTNGDTNNSFKDNSTNNFTVSVNTGSPILTALTPYIPTGYWSCACAGGSYGSFNNSAVLQLGSSNVTIEFWVWADATLGTQEIIYTDNITPSGSNTSYNISIINGVIVYYLSSTGTTWDIASAVSMGAILANTWTHVAICRQGNTWTPYVNGIAGTSTTNTAALFNFTGQLYVNGTTNPLTGYLSNLRIIKGSVVYTSAFSPPSNPLPGTNNTVLLTCQSWDFKDTSASGLTSSAGNTLQFNTFSPFLRSGFFTPNSLGGSIYFNNGSGLSVSDNTALQLGSGDFTIELWCYALTSSAGYIISKGSASPNLSWAIQDVNTIYFLGSSNGTSADIPAKNFTGSKPYTWQHIAITREQNTFRLFANGVLSTSFTSTLTLFNSTSDLEIGKRGNGRYYGYISDVRIIKGTAKYTSNFSVPTAPLTADVNTTFLLNATPGIYDAKSKNFITVNGDTKVSTTSSKFKGASIFFDGSGDSLSVLDSVELRFYQNNFTVETWINPSSTNCSIVNKGSLSTGWLVSLNSSNNVVFSYGSASITSTNTISTGTWNHIAVTRSGTGTNQTQIFVNGILGASGTVSYNFNEPSDLRIGVNRSSVNTYTGYIQDLRITANVARYTSNFEELIAYSKTDFPTGYIS